jgi:hypothetical protein
MICSQIHVDAQQATSPMLMYRACKGPRLMSACNLNDSKQNAKGAEFPDMFRALSSTKRLCSWLLPQCLNYHSMCRIFGHPVQRADSVTPTNEDKQPQQTLHKLAAHTPPSSAVTALSGVLLMSTGGHTPSELCAYHTDDRHHSMGNTVNNHRGR